MARAAPATEGREGRSPNGKTPPVSTPVSALDSEPEAESPAPVGLEGELDKLALQIVKRATRQTNDGLYVEPLPMQLNALKVAGTYYGLRKKHTPVDEGEGSGWGSLFMNGEAPLGDDDAEDAEDEEGEEEELNG